MMKKLLLPIVGVAVLSLATPSFAGFWGQSRDSRDWSRQWNERQNDSRDWNNDNRDWNNDCDPKDNPVPEPATAGLSLMGLSALAVATRRRKK